MAIVEMKKLHVIAMADRKESLLQGLLRLGCVEIYGPEDVLLDEQWAGLFQRSGSLLAERTGQLNDTNTALNAIRQYAGTKEGVLIQRRSMTEDAFLDVEAAKNAEAAGAAVRAKLERLAQARKEEEVLTSRVAALLPWRALELPLEHTGTAHVIFRLGICPGWTDLEALRIQLSAENLAAEMLEISADKLQKYVLVMIHCSVEDRVQELLRAIGFSTVAFSDHIGTAEEAIGALESALAENRRIQTEIKAAIAAAGTEQANLQAYADRLRTERLKETCAGSMLTDGTILFFQGWFPAEKESDVGAFLTENGCAWETCDPTEEEIPDVPVQLKNNWLTRPLNMVTEMYSLPSYDNVDPNPLMAPFFILFYGIMMADMGYGLLMFLTGILVTRKYRPRGTMGHLFSLMTLCGVSTFVMGALTGGFFGDFLTQLFRLTGIWPDFVLPALFTPLDDTLMILIGSMALGLIQIITGMAISFFRKLRAGRVMDAVWEEVTWWIVFAGIALLILESTPWVLGAGIAMVVLGPLLTNRGLAKITGIFGSLYNHITGYFGDILSYSRLMALMLAGSVIAQVFNTLGAIPGNVVLFVLISMAGNALNFALNLLGCYVHDLRLQCLEYFGKFYKDGGRPFRPLAVETKYVDVQGL